MDVFSKVAVVFLLSLALPPVVFSAETQSFPPPASSAAPFAPGPGRPNSAESPVPQDTGLATIKGQILTKEGKPLAEGMVHLFKESAGPPPSPDKYWRVPDLSRRLDQEGKFSIEVVEGTYYVGAIKRLSGKSLGPPQEGDLFFTDADARGVPKAYTVTSGVPLDLGVLTGVATFKKSQAQYGNGVTSVEGTVVDTEGKPVDKVYVLASYFGASTGKPVFVSEATGKDGKYILRVADGGNYLLKVRSTVGGPPTAGEIVGTLTAKGQIAVTLENGEKVRGIEIQVSRFAGRGVKPPQK